MNQLRSWVPSVVAVAIGVAVAIAMLVVGSSDPAHALRAYFVSPFSNRFFFGNMLSSSGYLLVAAIGIVVAFRAGLYNLGGDGQIYVGALAGTMVGLALPGLPGPVGTFVLLTAAAATGALMAGASGVAKHLWDAPEIITSYLLSAAMIPVADYAISGPLRDPSRSLLASARIPDAYRLAQLLPPSDLNTSAIVAVVLAIALLAWIRRTTRGYELRMVGLNRDFAAYVGISRAGYTIGALAVSGALHGLSGGLMIVGTYHAAVSGFSLGIGWNAIAVALVARLDPLLAIASALLFGYLEAGARTAMLQTDFTFQLGMVVQAVILFFVTGSVLMGIRRR